MPAPRRRKSLKATSNGWTFDLPASTCQSGCCPVGNQQKALLARWLATEPDILILDEPTRGIDVGAHAEIIELIQTLKSHGMALIVASSELEELMAYSSRIIVLRDRRQVGELKGDEMSIDSIVKCIADEEARS